MPTITISDLLSQRTEVRIEDLLSKKDDSDVQRINSKLTIERQDGQIIIRGGNKDYQYRSKTWAEKRLKRLAIVYELGE